MKHIVMLKTELSVEERNLFSVSYKNLIGSRRGSWRTVNTLEEKEAAIGDKCNEKRLHVIRGYRQTIEKEMTEICTEVIKLLDDFLIPSSSQTENRTFFYKM